MGKKHFIPDISKLLKLYSSDNSLNGIYKPIIEDVHGVL